ncbi:MAG: alpha/beta fold hydrolase [Roseivirga sp.]
MKLYWQQLGQGPPVLILPGLLGSADNWRTIAQGLASRYTLYLIDHRNHGRSFHSDEMTYEAMAADLKHWMTQQGIAEPALIGHSMGGKVVMQFAQTYPQALSRLIVVDIAPRVYDMTQLTRILQILRQTPLQGVRRRAEVDQLLCAHIPEPVMRMYLMKNLGRNEQGELLWRSNILVLAESIPHLAQAVTFQAPFGKPTLFIKADQSDYMQPQDLSLIKAMFPNYQLECIENSTHWVLYYQPLQLLKTIAHFLASHN